MTMTMPELTDHENAMSVALSVRDYLLANPERFSQSTWGEEGECGTVACIAGWVGILHDDAYVNLDAYRPAGTPPTIFSHESWEGRQAARLGITRRASRMLFNNVSGKVALEMLLGIAQWHEANPDRAAMTYDEIDVLRVEVLKKKGIWQSMWHNDDD